MSEEVFGNLRVRNLQDNINLNFGLKGQGLPGRRLVFLAHQDDSLDQPVLEYDCSTWETLRYDRSMDLTSGEQASQREQNLFS